MRLIFLMADAFRRYWINAERKGEQKSFVAETAQATSKWIEDNYKCEDFLLWVDTFQCHEPFDPPEYWREQHYRDYDSFPTVYPNDGPSSKYTREQMLRVNFDGETYLTSKWLGYLLRTLEDVGIHDDCFICLVSDHGTYLGEHGRSGKFLLPPEIQKSTPWPQCDELHRIPMLIKMPGQKKNAYRKHRDVARKMGRAYVRFLESVGCEAGKAELMAGKFQYVRESRRLPRAAIAHRSLGPSAGRRRSGLERLRTRNTDTDLMTRTM